MSRFKNLDEPQIVDTKTENALLNYVEQIINIFEKYFDKYSEQLPLLEEITQFINNNNVLVITEQQKVIDEYNKMKEYARSFGILIRYLGFKSCIIDVKHSVCFEGKSSYTLTKLFRLGTDVILSNSDKTLKLAVKFGFIISVLSFMLAIYNIIAKLTGVIQVAGFTTTIFSIWFVGGIILFVLGIVGLYIERIFTQVKERQLFIVKDEINVNE